MTKLDSRLLSLRVASDVAELLERQAKRERRTKTAVLEYLVRQYCTGKAGEDGAFRARLLAVRDYIEEQLKGADDDVKES